MLNYFKKLYKKDAKSFYEEVSQNLKNKNKMFIVTANPETFSYGEKEEKFNTLLMDKNTTLIPDGISIVKAAKMLGFKIKERIAGIDLANELLDICNENNYKLCLMGSKEEVIIKLQEVIKDKYPNIKLGKCQDGYGNDIEKDNYFNEIVKEKPDVCLIALGIPKQEELIYKHLDKFKKGIFVGVGGSFDVMSGTKKRAPKFFQKMNIEWLYRICKEPSRLKRFFNNNIKFIFKIKRIKRKKIGDNIKN